MRAQRLKGLTAHGPQLAIDGAQFRSSMNPEPANVPATERQKKRALPGHAANLVVLRIWEYILLNAMTAVCTGGVLCEASKAASALFAFQFIDRK